MTDIAIVRNCVLPFNLHYAVEEHIWVRSEPDGTATLGFTDVAQAIAGGILHVSFRPVGQIYAVGKVVAVVEGAKWLGPLRTPVAGRLEEANSVLLEDAGLINRSPYRRGWVARLAPENLRRDLAALQSGGAAIGAYETLMTRRNLDQCVHCEGYEMP